MATRSGMVSQFPDWTYSYASTGILATTVTFHFCISSGAWVGAFGASKASP